MCGIVGYICNDKNAKNVILNNLKKLEYRGYDSAGVCFFDNNKFDIHKSIGEIKNLEKILNATILSNCGIAHTRWATHGKVCLQNTHPHLSNDKNWCVVHNGIIENYLELKKFLKSKHIKFGRRIRYRGGAKSFKCL